MLQSKPEAGRKVLSDNSLLKNIDFNEKFLGEDQITETLDLPPQPNEAQVFYANMSKVVLSLLGTTERSEPGQVERAEQAEWAGQQQDEEEEEEPLQRHSAGHGTQTLGVFTNGNISLDVLPVKGPQGPALGVAEPSLKCVLSVSSWPASSSSAAAVEPDAPARPDVFAKRVVLVAVAENPAIE
ncbi:hypothetical protein CRUP_025071, partial [Coryphaenoides rupestris]